MILFLTLFFSFDQHIAQATNLVCFIPSAIVSIIYNSRKKNINFKNAIVIVIFGIIGAVAGALVSKNMPVFNLRKWFGCFLIVICLYEIYSYYILYIKNKK